MIKILKKRIDTHVNVTVYNEVTIVLEEEGCIKSVKWHRKRT